MKIAILLAALAILASTSTKAQGPPDWNTIGNNTLNPVTSFLGNTDGIPINFRTNNVLRMRLNESLPGQPVNNFPNVDLSGHLGIGAPVPPQALSFLHINNNGSFFAGFRPWMRRGKHVREHGLDVRGCEEPGRGPR